MLGHGAGPFRESPMSTAPDLLQLNPFHRLNQLLAGLAPGRSPLPDGKPVNLSVGDPRTTMPAFAAEAMRAADAGWSRYAPARGHPDYLAAVQAWLDRRYALPAGFLDPARHLVPVAGSREGLFFAVLAAVAAKRAALGGEQPVILLPDPGYHVYAGATAAAGAEAIYVPATDGLPDYGAVAPEVLRRAALAFLCTPANPQGVVAGRDRLAEALRQARQAGYLLAVDECYSEIHGGEAPTGGLRVAAESGSLEGLLVFNSLSKRSGAPGLRLGFIAGDAAMIRAIEGFLRFGGAGPGVPLLAAGAALWREEGHVADNRAYYDRNLRLAERILGNGFGWRRPAGGFFLWLDVSPGRFDDGEAATRALYSEGGITVLPGAYLSVGRVSVAAAPGRSYLRASLAEPPAILEPVLTRVAEILL
jgi:N-succinyldiaminopimelate aminotransferase